MLKFCCSSMFLLFSWLLDITKYISQEFLSNKGVGLNNIFSYFQLWHSFVYSFLFQQHLLNITGGIQCVWFWEHRMYVLSGSNCSWQSRWLCWDDTDRNSRQTLRRTTFLASSHLPTSWGALAGRRWVLLAQSSPASCATSFKGWFGLRYGV